VSESKVAIHRRSIQVDAFESGPNQLTVAGNLVDGRPQGGPAWLGGEGPRVIHDMRVALTVRRQAAGAAFVEKKGAPPMPRDRWLINTCQAWREGGPLHTLLETGDAAGLRAAQTPGFLGRPAPGE
jgi:hypothetical protein